MRRSAGFDSNKKKTLRPPNGKARMAAAPVVHIIDDDDAVRDSLAVLLEAEDLTVRRYSSAREFLGAPPAAQGCIVSDVQMAELSGIELLRAINDDGARRMPVILMSGRAGRVMEAEARQHGAAAFLYKPFAPEEVLAAVREALAAA